VQARLLRSETGAYSKECWGSCRTQRLLLSRGSCARGHHFPWLKPYFVPEQDKVEHLAYPTIKLVGIDWVYNNDSRERVD